MNLEHDIIKLYKELQLEKDSSNMKYYIDELSKYFNDDKLYTDKINEFRFKLSYDNVILHLSVLDFLMRFIGSKLI